AAVDSLPPDAHSRPLLFGVTVLTSFALGEMPGITAAPADFALQLATGAATWGLDGVVCSGQEAARIKAAAPGLRCLCPGIRPAGSDAGDQRRIMTPAEAVAAGADYLVVGRPILAAPSPVTAARQILAEMDAVHQQR
ncbi:MAG: orotidine 5'-phosphate decarboxylase / HUMPS family protein, partial [Desulfovibrionaceae bacterium]|nr:orotidine 5'-phosphate decarboxylase / HUMPS family protein [Desulfovibrionaceae bacterium]